MTSSPPTPDVPGPRRRPPPSRLEAGVLTTHAGPEGLAWLGRVPEARASLLYRALRLLARAVFFGLLRFKVDTSGQENIPSRTARGGKGYLVVAAAHRGWMDPFVAMHALPPAPRAWFLGSGPSTFTSPWRERLIRRIGGLLPVWRGGIGVDAHVASAQAVLDAGGVFVQMPEGTVSGPSGRLGPFRTGAALIALRTGAPIVPIALAGTEELYVGKRMASRVLPATSARELAGLGPDDPLPAEGSRAELEMARRITAGLEAILEPVVEAIHPATADPPPGRRLLRDRLTWLFLRRGRLDRDSPDANGSVSGPA